MTHMHDQTRLKCGARREDLTVGNRPGHLIRWPTSSD